MISPGKKSFNGEFRPSKPEQRYGRLKSTVEQEIKATVIDSEEDRKDDYSIVCRPTQCLFCMSDDSLPNHHRIYEYIKPGEMMNEVERHLQRFVLKGQVLCPHPRCKAASLILFSVMAFKIHTAT